MRTCELGGHVLPPDEGESKFLSFVEGKGMREVDVIESRYGVDEVGRSG